MAIHKFVVDVVPVGVGAAVVGPSFDTYEQVLAAVKAKLTCAVDPQVHPFGGHTVSQLLKKGTINLPEFRLNETPGKIEIGPSDFKPEAVARLTLVVTKCAPGGLTLWKISSISLAVPVAVDMDALPDDAMEALDKLQSDAYVAHQMWNEPMSVDPVGYAVLDEGDYVRENPSVRGMYLYFDFSEEVMNTLFREIRSDESDACFEEGLQAAMVYALLRWHGFERSALLHM